MSQGSPLTVATALTVPPLDQGSVIAGHRGLTRDVRWVVITHVPAEAFVRAGDLVLTTSADSRQPGVREFLAFLISSPAAGVVLCPPPGIDTRELVAKLVPLADRHEFPLVLLPWEVAFTDVQRNLLPLVSATAPDTQVQMAIGRREGDDAGWSDSAHAFTEALQKLAFDTGIAVKSSVTDDLVMSHFSSAQPASTVSDLVESAEKLCGMPDDAISWVLLPPAHSHSVTVPASAPHVAEGAVGPAQFAEVLRHHPLSMATILETLRPLVDYDKTRRGQLVHTLEILLDEATNTSAAARALYLNRHSLLYRIKLIEELTGMSLKNSADRFQLEVSVRVHEINEKRGEHLNPAL
jgi:hypothetical protein